MQAVNTEDSDEHFMALALREAEKALALDEVPIGAVIVDAGGDILASASNRTIIDNDPTAHAEILALRMASAKIGNYRLTGSTLYTTIEPCVMCAGALVNARIERLVFGAHDERFGAVETKFRLCDSDVLNHRMEIVPGVLSDECRKLVKDFFRGKRNATDSHAQPTKACPVVLRTVDGLLQILAFHHPLTGTQLVKGTVEPGESAEEASLRELFEEAAIQAKRVVKDLGLWNSGVEGQVWSFQLCETHNLPDSWTHFANDGGGMEFSFFWHPLDAEPDETWDELFKNALYHIRESI